MANFLMDKEFLKQLDLSSSKTIYVRFIALNANEEPVERIEGRATSGSINVDGKSALRRTCNITLVGEEMKITEFYWAIKSKFKVEIGILNEIDPDKYDKILWFNQGIFVINSFSKSLTNSGLTVSISGQDKMCLLNGTLGGALPVEVNFGDYEDEDGTIKKILIKDIIAEALQTYGQEPLSNIIINDLDEVKTYELYRYSGDKPLYYYYKVNRENNQSTHYYPTLYNVSIDQNKIMKKGDTSYKVSALPESYYYSRNNVINKENRGLVLTSSATEKEFLVSKVEAGQEAGYRQTGLVYPGESKDLTLSAGSPLTSLLDKIVSALGEYEYFYDTGGRFIFQKKKTYTQGLFTPIVGDNAYVIPASDISAYEYKFNDATLVSSYSNALNVSGIKNDFVIWGTRKTLSGAEVDFHARFAICKKPTYYRSLRTGIVYRTKKNNEEDPTAKIVDWRELIYQMADDYSRYKNTNNYHQRLITNNPTFYTGLTGYEPYYIDIQGFWREIYDGSKFIIDSPQEANFWLEFIEPYGDLTKFDVAVLGNRLKVDNNKNVTDIWYPDIPEVEFLLPGEKGKDNYNSANQEVKISNSLWENYFSISPTKMSAFERANNLLNTHVLLASSITLNVLPIYYLSPNTRIYVKNEKAQIDGDYIINSFSIPLTPGATMNISATQIVNTYI